MLFSRLAIVLGLVAGAAAFAPPQKHSRAIFRKEVKSTTLWSNREDDTISQAADIKKKSGLDASVRNKLLAESIAPWRTIRLFLYFALGSGAFVGGLITLSGVVAGLGGARTDLDLNTEVS